MEPDDPGSVPANQRSVRILQRLGLRETGRGDEGVFLDQPTHYRRFAITAVDWTTKDDENDRTP